ncbi:MAG: ribonuclease P protein component [Egibacteraceae bacterium]
MSVDKVERLRRGEDIRRVFRTRRVAHGRLLSVHVAARGSAGPPRVAVMAGRGVGNAVRRNRAKRRVRALLGEGVVGGGVDVVVVARRGMVDAPFDGARAELAALLERARTVARVSQ